MNRYHGTASCCNRHVADRPKCGLGLRRTIWRETEPFDNFSILHACPLAAYHAYWTVANPDWQISREGLERVGA